MFDDDDDDAMPKYTLPVPLDKRERDADALLRKRRRRDAVIDIDDTQEAAATAVDDDDDDDYLSREFWTHLPSGEAFVYPLSRYLDPTLAGGREPRLVMFRVNSGSAVAPFLEFALARGPDGASFDWPRFPTTPKDDGGLFNFFGRGGGDEKEEDDDDDDALVVRATSAAHDTLCVKPGDGCQAPRFCGAWRGQVDDYAWFQVDPNPAAEAMAELAWVTVHDLVKARAVRGERLRDGLVADFAAQPLLWCICDADRQVPVEIPVTLEPLAYRRPPNDVDGGDVDGDVDARLFALETDRANYVETAVAEGPDDHGLFGHSLFAFHDPHWPAFLAAASPPGGDNDALALAVVAADNALDLADVAGNVLAPLADSAGDDDDDAETVSGGGAERRPATRYAVFLHDTLYLIGDCLRENAALLAFADDREYSSVYLPMQQQQQRAGSFVWLVKSSDQFVPLK